MFKKIYLEITNYCNKKCAFCSRDSRELREMSLSEIKRIIPDIKKHTSYLYLHVKGEPLLHSEFFDILKYLNEEKIWINITTNGTLLKKNIDIISNCEYVRQINISVHSFNDSNYIDDIVYSTNKLLVSNNRLNIVFRFWTLSNNSFTSEMKKNLDYIINSYNLDKDIINKIYNEKNIKISDRLYINKDDLFEWPNLKNKVYPDSYCLGLKSHIAILSNGMVVPCCLDSDGVINLGNIFDTSLDDILNSTKAQQIMNGFLDNKCVEPLCKHCSFRLK